MRFTFKHGVHPRGYKDLSANCAFEEMSVGERVYIPVSQHIGAPCTPTVTKGDFVKAGTLIGVANGFVSANIFSSISGEVEGFSFRENVLGRKIRHIVIKNDGLYEEETLPIIEGFEKAKLLRRIEEAGIVGMGGATFPTHVKMKPKNPIKTLIINGAECEPYITTDYRLMLEKTAGILEGVKILREVLGAEEVFIGIEDNKPEAIKRMRELADSGINVVSLKTKYPQGGEKQLIYAIKKVEVPEGKLPSDIACVVDNVATAYAVYEAVRLGKPSYARYMTVSGKGINTPKNLYVRNGVPFFEIADVAGIGEYDKAVAGGTMMGFAISNLDCVATKGTSSLLLLQESELRPIVPSTCLNCAKCHKACPMHLMPMYIDAFALEGKIDVLETYRPTLCMECGCCSYVCPAKRPLVQSIRLAKKMLRERGSNK